MPTALRPVLLLTRPEPDSHRFAALLPEFEAVISPILRIAPVEHDSAALARAPGLVFTSAHAVGAAAPGRGRLAICVGARTACVARAAGFVTQEGNGFAESLLPLIADAPVPLIHPRGRHLAKPLPVPGVIVYDQHEQPLSGQALALLKGVRPVILPLFSPRSARLLSAGVACARAPLSVAAISDAALAAWSGPVGQARVAATPDAAAMADIVKSLASGEHSR